jgi:hypothetical protein
LRIAELKRTETALAQSEDSRRSSEEKFEKVFQSSPVPFSITTMKEGRFVDVDARSNESMAIRAPRCLDVPFMN